MLTMTTFKLDGGLSVLTHVRRGLRELWRIDRPLTALGLLMIGETVTAMILMVVDGRTIAGAPAWLKPAKFGASTAIYSLTLAWIFGFLPGWRRLRRFVSLTTSIIFLLEIPIIAAQAWRGTTSHFNVSTPLNATLFALMGIGIFIQTLASVGPAVALWRQRFANEAMGWALRAGFTLTIVGALTGGLMTRPTDTQLTQARVTHRMTTAGAHTVGAPDGGPGLPGTGWSTEHGDLRVPHFAGLHAVQVLALVAFAVSRRGTTASSVRLVQSAAVSYALLFGILLTQALRGESIVSPDPTTLLALGAWAVLTVAGFRIAGMRRQRRGQPAAVVG